MDFLLYIYIFCYGIVLGSFYNVVGLRMPLGQSIIKPRSKCPECGHTLSIIELIPVFSYLFLKGECSKCKTKISFIYPMIEFITGCLFVLALYKATSVGFLIVSITLISMLIIITVSDIAYQLILNKHLLFFGALYLLEYIYFEKFDYRYLLQAAAMFILMYAFAVVMEKILKKEAFGGGDIKLLTLLTFIMGFTNVLLVIYIAAIICLLYIIVTRSKSYIAFGPFISISTIIVWFYGQNIINIYTSIFL